MRHLYSVGEDVILCSKDFPEVNGDALVIGVVIDGESVKCPHCGSKTTPKIRGCGVGYYLNTNSGRCCSVWNQSALRKKPKPSAKSFHQIIEIIKELA